MPPETAWRAWTDPQRLKQWFCPRPWRAPGCQIELRPGGTFHTVLQGADGMTMDNPGCALEVVPKPAARVHDRARPGYRPQDRYIPFTAIITLKPKGKGTRYHVLARHKDEAAAKQRVEMGFHQGWSKALDQVVEVVKGGESAG